MTTDTGSGSGSGTGSGSGSGTGGAKAHFFHALRKNMENKGWKTVFAPGFNWAAIETEHYVMLALSWVALLTVTLLTVTPAPKLTVVLP